MIAADFALFVVTQARVHQEGGSSLVLRVADGHWLVRFLLPSVPGGHNGRFADGYSEHFGAALQTAIRGLRFLVEET